MNHTATGSHSGDHGTHAIVRTNTELETLEVAIQTDSDTTYAEPLLENTQLKKELHTPILKMMTRKFSFTKHMTVSLLVLIFGSSY